MNVITNQHFPPKCQVEMTKVATAATATIALADAIPVNCYGAKAISLTIDAKDIASRSGVVTVYIANDWSSPSNIAYQYNMLLDNVANTNTQTLTRVASKTVAATGNAVLFFEPKTLGAFSMFKVVLTITDGGTPAGTFDIVANVAY